jgi:hypothetical protein
MSEARIDAQARGQLHVWKAAAAQRFTLGEARWHTPELQQASIDLVLRSSPEGRTRAFNKLRRAFGHASLEGVRLDGPDPIAVWAVLKPREALRVDPAHPRDGQDCVVVEYLVAGPLPHKGLNAGGIAAGIWTVEATDHALGRLLQRDRAAKIDAVLLAAHHAVLRAKATDVADCFADHEKSFLVPAGSGVFVCSVIKGSDVSNGHQPLIHVRARTWLHRDQLSDRQETNVVIDDGSPGDRLGEGLLLPMPLRKYVQLSANEFATVNWAPGMPETLARPRGTA